MITARSAAQARKVRVIMTGPAARPGGADLPVVQGLVHPVAVGRWAGQKQASGGSWRVTRRLLGWV